MNKKHLISIGILSAFISSCGLWQANTSAKKNIYIAVVNKKTLMLIPDAECQLIDSMGQVYQAEGNPATINVGGLFDSTTITCKAPGYVQRTVGMASNYDELDLNNITQSKNHASSLIYGTEGTAASHMIVYMSTTAPPPYQKIDQRFNVDHENELIFQGQQTNNE